MRDLRATIDAIREIALVSQGDSSLTDVFDHICGVIGGAFGFDRVAISRFHAATREVSPVALFGDTPEHIPPRLSVDAMPLMAEAMATQRVVYVADVRATNALAPELVEAYGVTSVFCIPLFSSGHCLGFLAGDRRGARFELDEFEVATLDMIGVITATLLEKVLLREEMQRLDSMKSEFIAIASHELRTPLASVYGISVTLDERGDELTDSERHELRRVLREQTQRIRTLVEQLLDLSRFDIAAVDVAPEPTTLRPRLQEIVDVVSAGDAVTLDVDPALEVAVDPVALDRIVSNLISNALRYGAPPVTVSAARADGQVRVAVEDRGEGVNDAFVPRLFERFSRSHASRDKSSGSGLGLSIARAYAQAHGGDLVYEHAEPHGARFVLVLPDRE
ncbi:MAG TPA: GAF domain-containing sensor histidine kinase [Gaiellaceae bacterium]|nr:GAF domain-containing sensor histidine kinase [Gaiellaceae bacterium]